MSPDREPDNRSRTLAAWIRGQTVRIRPSPSSSASRSSGSRLRPGSRGTSSRAPCRSTLRGPGS